MTESTSRQVFIFSLDYEAWLEAEIFKWLESERAGHDRGHPARQEWVRRHWDDFCRWRLVDHLFGHKCFKEFNVEAFGCLKDPSRANSQVVQYVLKKFVDERWENLNFLGTIDVEIPRQPVYETLDLFRINDGRHTQPCWYNAGKI
jgi:hypothetical protein